MSNPNVYIIKSDNIDLIINELKNYRHKCRFSIIESNNAKDILTQIGILEEDNRISQALHKRNSQIIIENYSKTVEQVRSNKKFEQEMKIKEFINSFLMNPAAQLSDDDIRTLCNEFYFEFIYSNKKLQTKPPKPNIEILNYFDKNVIKSCLKNNTYKKVFNNYLKNTFKYIKKSTYEEIYFPYYDRFENCDYEILNYNSSFGGIFQATEGYYKLYFADYKEIDSKNKIFLNWYKKAFNVLAMYYNENNNTIYVIKRPQKNNFRIAENGDITIVYGNNKQFIKGHLSLDYINRTPAEDLNIEDYASIRNADAKAKFVEKIGFEKLFKYGILIDTYENYPDNEMWAKSEYKIIDMHKIIPPRRKQNQNGHDMGIAQRFSYAPFLYMKNQTTGVYHLEGVNPECKTLYDAIKMRYNGLNIKDYDIKDIK